MLVSLVVASAAQRPTVNARSRDAWAEGFLQKLEALEGQDSLRDYLRLGELDHADHATPGADMGRALLAFLGRPLWPRWDPRRFPAQRLVERWSQACIQHEGRSHPQSIDDVLTLIEAYPGFVNGPPTWRSLLSTGLRTVVQAILKEDVTETGRIRIAADEVALLLGRLAFLDPSHMPLAEAPTPERFRAALEHRTLAGAEDLVGRLKELTEGFEADPVWQAWVGAAFGSALESLWKPEPSALAAVESAAPDVGARVAEVAPGAGAAAAPAKGKATEVRKARAAPVAANKATRAAAMANKAAAEAEAARSAWAATRAAQLRSQVRTKARSRPKTWK
jgi:hypothetical protein